MARRKRVYKKPDIRDPRYDSPLVARFINKLMVRGKKSLAERIVYAAIDKVNESSNTVDPLEIVDPGGRERQAAAGSEIPPRRWRDLSGAA